MTSLTEVPPKYPISSACDLIPEPFCLDSQATAYVVVGVSHDIVQSDWATAKSTVNDGYYSTVVTQFHSLDTFAPASTFPQMLGQFLGLFQSFAQSGSSPLLSHRWTSIPLRESLLQTRSLVSSPSHR